MIVTSRTRPLSLALSNIGTAEKNLHQAEAHEHQNCGGKQADRDGPAGQPSGEMNRHEPDRRKNTDGPGACHPQIHSPDAKFLASGGPLFTCSDDNPIPDQVERQNSNEGHGPQRRRHDQYIAVSLGGDTVGGKKRSK